MGWGYCVWQMGKKRRFAYIAIGAIVFSIVYSAGAESTMSDEDAKSLKEEFGKAVEDIDAFGIFLNNFRIAAAMFIPALGVIIGVISAYSTGLVFRALAETMPQIAEVPPLIILVTPFGIMELFSYGTAMSQSAILLHTMLRRRSLKPLIIPTMIQIGIVAAVLFIGAIIEYYMIEAFGPEVDITGTI
jgi:hypothetical protein